MAKTYLDFERPIADLERKIEELQALNGKDDGPDVTEEITRLKTKVADQIRTTYDRLDAWQRTQVARHPERPHFEHYREGLIAGFTPLAGDRRFGEDHALLGGLGHFRGRPVVVIGHEKGSDTEARIKHNFGMARPEGYRKAIRIMDMAAQFELPVLAFVDTAGAYPGIGAEERGQAEAIARAIERCLSLPVPMVAVITGEGGSGGAVAIASCDRVLMLEHSIYSVISPEGCASILWKDAARAPDAAKAMKISAPELESFSIIDSIVSEPAGGAHRDPNGAVEAVGDALEAALSDLIDVDPAERIAARQERFLRIGRDIAA